MLTVEKQKIWVIPKQQSAQLTKILTSKLTRVN